MSTLFSLMLVGLSLGQAPQPVQPFPDVPKTHWAYAAVTELHEKGIVKGYPGKYDRSTPHAALQSRPKSYPQRRRSEHSGVNDLPMARALVRTFADLFIDIAEADRNICFEQTNAWAFILYPKASFGVVDRRWGESSYCGGDERGGR